MTDQPVTPDREALREAVVSVLRGRLGGRFIYFLNTPTPESDEAASAVVDAVLPLLTDALDRARQQGRDEAAAAIEAFSAGIPNDRGPWTFVVDVLDKAARLARGGPNRKDEE